MLLHQLWLRLRSLVTKKARRVFLACRLLLLGDYQVLLTMRAVSRQQSATEKHVDALDRKAQQLQLTTMLISQQLAKLKPDSAAIVASKSAAEAAANAAATAAAQAQRAASAQHRAQWLAMASRAMRTHSRARDRSPGNNKRRRPPIPIANSNVPGRRRL